MRSKIAFCIVSALLLSLGWLGATGLTALVALVPLLLISRTMGDSRREAWIFVALCALTFGAWSAATTWWIWYAAPIGAILSVLFTAFLCTVPMFLFHYVSKRAPLALAYTLFVTCYLAGEWLYNTGELSFPWLFLGNAFANAPWAVQWYEYTGIFGGSLWILVSNILIFEAVKNRSRWLAPSVWIAVPILISVVMYNTYSEGEKRVTVAAIQPNIDPYSEKFTIGQDEQTGIMLDLLDECPASSNFVLLPETAINSTLWEQQMQFSPDIEELRAVLGRRCPSALLITGATTLRSYSSKDESPTARYSEGVGYYDVYNSAIAIDTSAKVDIHHKSMLVVGVEKNPYPWVTEMLSSLIIDLGGTTGGLGTDSHKKVFTSPLGVRSSVGVCYESAYGEYFADFAAKGAEIIFVITNDGWWRDTPGYRQHFSFSRLRAIETRRSIARSANTGISGFINQRGDVVEQLGWDKRGAISAELTLNDKVTVYSLWGDYILRISNLAFLLSLIYYPAYRIRRKNLLVE